MRVFGLGLFSLDIQGARQPSIPGSSPREWVAYAGCWQRLASRASPRHTLLHTLRMMVITIYFLAFNNPVPVHQAGRTMCFLLHSTLALLADPLEGREATLHITCCCRHCQNAQCCCCQMGHDLQLLLPPLDHFEPICVLNTGKCPIVIPITLDVDVPRPPPFFQQ